MEGRDIHAERLDFDLADTDPVNTLGNDVAWREDEVEPRIQIRQVSPGGAARPATEK